MGFNSGFKGLNGKKKKALYFVMSRCRDFRLAVCSYGYRSKLVDSANDIAFRKANSISTDMERKFPKTLSSSINLSLFYYYFLRHFLLAYFICFIERNDQFSIFFFFVNNPMKQRCPWEIVSCSASPKFQAFIETPGSWPCSQQYATGPIWTVTWTCSTSSHTIGLTL